MSLISKISGKAKALKALYKHIRYFKDGADKFKQYKNGEYIPCVHTRDGLEIHVGKQDDLWSLFNEIFIEKIYAGNSFYVPKPNDVVIDCGGNIGLASLQISKLCPSTKIYCIEASAETYMRLTKNIQVNNLENQILTFNNAIFNKRGVLKLAKASFAGSSSMVQDNQNQEYEDVNALTLAEFFEEQNITKVNFLKMDIEGAEVEVLESLTDETWDMIDKLVIEYHEEIRPGSFNSLSTLLKKHFDTYESWPISKNNELGIIRVSKNN